MTLLKNLYFQKSFIDKLATSISNIYPDFDGARFKKQIAQSGWTTLELKGRMHRIADALHQFLPDDYCQSLIILIAASPEFHGFDAMVFPDFVERYGMDSFDESIDALASFTELCSSEFAVRPFIEANPSRMFCQLKRWAQSDNEHLRRLASEGCRPRLPWAGPLRFLISDPTPILPILDILKADSSEYVRKSVANNLNDISKDHPDTLIALVKKWNGENPNTQWILKHASRTLLKQGRPDVLRLFGFDSPKNITCSKLKFNRSKVTMGDAVSFTCTLTTTKKKLGKLRLEYVIDFVKSNGASSSKVFQICEKIETTNKLTISKQHAFKNLSTRKHYPGKHNISVRVNGIEKAAGQIELMP